MTINIGMAFEVSLVKFRSRVNVYTVVPQVFQAGEKSKWPTFSWFKLVVSFPSLLHSLPIDGFLYLYITQFLH